MRCLADAWERHEAELRRFLRHRAGSEAEGDGEAQTYGIGHVTFQPEVVLWVPLERRD